MTGLLLALQTGCIRAASNIVSVSVNMSDSSPFGLPDLSSRPLLFLKVLANLSPPTRKHEVLLKFSHSVSFRNNIDIIL